MTDLRFTGRKHDLKTHPEPFKAVRSGLKPWELRKNDRDYKVGDLLWLREWCPDQQEYTGEATGRLVTWMLRGPAFGLPEGYVILSLDTWPPPAADALSRATDEEGLARVLHARFEERAQRRSGLFGEAPRVPDTWESLSPGRRRDFIDDARAIIAHIKGEKKDG